MIVSIGEKISKAKTKDWKFNKNQFNIVEGMLLGDGGISFWKQREKSKKLFFSNNSLEFCMYIKQLLPEGYCGICKNSNKNHFHLFGKSCDFIKRMYVEWYDTNGRIIPLALELNRVNLLIWYISDGSLINRKNRSSYIQLCADRFPLIYVKELSEQLLDLGFVNKIFKHNYNPYRKKKCGFAIKFDTITTRRFLDFLGDYPINDYKYKWDYKEHISSFYY